MHSPCPVPAGKLYSDANWVGVKELEVARQRTLPCRRLRKCGSRLRAIIEPENAFNFALQFVGQMNRPCAATIGAALMFEPLKIDSEGAVELGDGAGENYAPPCGAFLHDREAVRAGEFFYLLNIARVGAELLRKISALDVLWWAAGAVKLLDSIA